MVTLHLRPAPWRQTSSFRNSLYPHDEEASDDEAQDTPDHERASHNGPRSDYKRSINGPGSDRKRSLNGPRVQHQPQESQRPGSAKRQKAIKVMSAGLTVHERDRGRSHAESPIDPLALDKELVPPGRVPVLSRQQPTIAINLS
jgi:hypothetical protein